MRVSEFDYQLPRELIAQDPLAERDQSRMLVVEGEKFHDSSFADFPNFIKDGDVVVVNNTRVFPARLIGYRRDKQGEQRSAEVLLLRPLNGDKNQWEVLARPGRALRKGTEIVFGSGRLRAMVTDVTEDGLRQIRFDCRQDFDQVVDEIGNTPLPPYIIRDLKEDWRLDEPRYQTIYAKERGAIAAPTAGLHFSPRIFEELRARGARIAEITHHVGYATFQPVRVDQVEEHHIAPEIYAISEESARTINSAKQAGRRIIAVGTTTVRALESSVDPPGYVRSERRATDLFIYPGFKFQVVDALLTNFHLPQSTLLMLVAAFAGRELILEAYRHAVAAKYRFYSYGDCMLLI